jgi:hypothetical protein
VAEEVGWPTEEIPDDALVFMRAHRQHFASGSLGVGVFREQQGGMSVDWQTYSTAQDTRARSNKPEDVAVISLPVSAVRTIQPLTVMHEPIFPTNRAHSEVFGLPSKGEDQAEVRMLLGRVYQLVIPLEPQA